MKVNQKPVRSAAAKSKKPTAAQTAAGRRLRELLVPVIESKFGSVSSFSVNQLGLSKAAPKSWWDKAAISVPVLDEVALKTGVRHERICAAIVGRPSAEALAESKPGNKSNPAWVGHSEAHRELFATVLGAGTSIPPDACKIITQLIQKLATKPVVPDPDTLSAPLISVSGKGKLPQFTKEQQEMLKEWNSKALFG